MSHIVKCAVKITNTEALQLAVEAITAKNEGFKYLGHGKHKLFNQIVEGVAVQLPNWSYPVVVKENGELVYDNYKGNWGKVEHLDKLLQEYSVQAIHAEAAINGQYVVTTIAENGDIQLEVMGG